ncbi:hypothetical protein KAR91_64535 [Candidatus Pacearchaeota archaeon]|nr:hypothetical protein [Candidatus Pacearchaeota archaeon]
MSQKFIPIKTIPFAGGVDLAHEPAALPNGALSQDQNFRPRRPGKESRLGQAKHHTTTAHGAKDIISLYGFSKSAITERHLFAQYDDGSVEEATDNPPAVTTGNFGTSKLSARHSDWTASTAYLVGDIVFSTTSRLLRFKCTVAGTSDSSEPVWPVLGIAVADNTVTWEAIQGIWPASWSRFNDMLIYTDGAGMGQIYTGQDMKPVLFNVYKGTGAIPLIPEEGADYTQEVIDGLTSTYADASSLDDIDANHCMFVMFDTPINKLTFAMSAHNGAEVGVAAIKYWNGTALTAVSGLSDGTDTSFVLDTDGDITWTADPVDEVPTYAFGRSGFLYQWSSAAGLMDSSVNIASVTGEYTGGFQDIQNVWDGIMPEATMALVEDTSASTFATYASDSILCGGLVGATAHDYLYISSSDPLFGIYLDIGRTPNVTASTAIDEVATWTGAAFTALSGVSTNDGGASTSFITWGRNTDTRKLNFNGTIQHAYWYRFRFSQTLSSSLVWSILTLPYFDINKIYPVMQATCAWDKRNWYSFNDNMLYGSDINKPMVLNGDNLVLVEAAKHSKNKAICMRRFYQFMLVWGEEKGEEGGYYSVIQPGKTASGYDSQVMSERIGIMNSKCAVILEDTHMGDLNTERPVMKAAFFLSRSGVYKTDGAFLKNVSGAIGNFFDPTRTECVRRGFEKEHFLVWDSVYGIIRLGLVSGITATIPNKFFIFDPVSDTWHEDVLGQPLSSIAEIDGASGNIPVLQYGGGQDGYIYRLNTTHDDVSTAIDKSLKIELDGEGHQIRLKGMAFVFKDQTAGDVIVDVYVNGAAASAYTQTLTMISSVGDYKGHRFNCDVMGDHLTIRLRNNVASQPVYLLEYGLNIERIENNIAYD